jgi:hypothetical protein
MIRAVQEFLCVHGRRREIRLAGAHYPVLLSITQMPGAVEGPALRIQYRGHREDLICLRCISREALATARTGIYEDGSRGVILHVESRTAAGRRRMLELSYIAQSRSFAATLPGVRTYCADWLETLTARPLLRLVIDNTRGQPGKPPAQPQPVS